MPDDLLKHAEEIAEAAHAGQTDKTGRPFIEHVRRVAAAVGEPGEKIVAFLHDVVEKGAGWGLERLAAVGFPAEILAAVDAMSRREGEDYGDFCRRALADPLARPVKCADLKDNLMQARQVGSDGGKYRWGLDLARQIADDASGSACTRISDV